MATGKKTQIVITANATTAKKVMEELQQRIDALKQKMQALDTTSVQGQKEFKKLEKELVSYNSAVAQNITNEERVKKAIGDLANTSLKDLRRALSSAKTILGQTFQNDPNLKKRQQDVKTLQQQIDKLTGSVHKNGNAWQTAVKNLTAYVGLFTLFNKAKDLMTGVLKKNFEFSSSLTDIRKVSGMAMEDVNKLATELAKIDTRTSIDGLAQLAYQGAKLGMGKYGVEGMTGFVRAADKVNVAIGEEMGKEALPALAKLIETMGLIPKMGIEKAMNATGSAMFKLSSTSTATSGNIVEFAKRLTGVARTAGITTDQLLALGSASDSMYLMPEVASTAMSKFIVALQRNHNLIEKDLGIQQGTIKNMYAAGNAMDAIVLVLERMKQTGNMNALGGIFKDLGSDGQRLVTAMVTMSKNVDMLKDHLYESQEAFEEATATTNEYEMQQQSAAGILERANNLWEKAFVNPEGVENVKALAESWYELSGFILQSPIYGGTLHKALEAVMLSLRGLIAVLPLIINYFVAWGAAKTATYLWNIGTAAVSAIKSIWGMATAQQAFNAAAKANVYVALASAIMTVVGVVWSYANAASEAAKREEEAQRKANAWKDTLGKAAVETSNLTRKLENYKQMMGEANLTQKQRQELISRFNRDFRSYISNLGIEIKNVKDLRDHYKELSQEAQRATYYRMREDAKQQALPKYDAERNSASNELMSRVKEAGLDMLGVTFKDIDRWVGKGANGNAVYKYLVSKLPEQKTGMISGLDYTIDQNGRLYTQNKSGKKMYASYDNQQLLSAARWYANATKRRDAKEAEIDNAYINFVPKGYTSYPEDEVGTLDNDAPDKKAAAEEKRRKQEQQRAWREELKQYQDEAKAIMDNLSNYYERQMNELTAQLISKGATETERALLMQPLKDKKDETMSQARRAISGNANTWDTTKTTLRGDMLEKKDPDTGVNLSEGLLRNIEGVNIEALRNQILGLEKALKMAYNSSTAEIFAKSTGNEKSILERQAKQAETRRKVAQENDYMGAVKQNMYDDFNTMGFANPTDTELADKEAFDERKKNIIKMYESAREQIGSLYALDMADEADHGLLMQLLFGDDPDGMGARISSVLGNSASDWQVFYHKLIQYSDEYTEAQKKTYDQQKKIANQMWAVNKRNLSALDQQRKLQEKQNMFGKQSTFWSELGLADIKNDPEVQLMKARMQAAEDYYAFIEKNSKNKQLLDEADKSRREAELAYTKQLVAAMQDRLSKMQSLVQPIETFGAEVGKAFATMSDSVSDAHEAIKNALKSMIETWGNMAINDVSKQMWQAINNAGAQRADKKAKPDIEAAQQNAATNASVALEWRNLGTADNPMWVRISGNQMIDANGTPLSEGEPPAAWQKRNPDGTIDDYNREAFGIESTASGATPAIGKAAQSPDILPSKKKKSSQAAAALADAGTQAGTAAADAATGDGSWSSVGMSALGNLGSSLLNTPMIGGSKGDSSNDDKKSEKQRKKELKAAKKHQRDLTSATKKGVNDRTNANQKGIDAITDATNTGADAQSQGVQIAQSAMLAATETGGAAILAATTANETAQTTEAAAGASTRTTLSLVEAVGKCFAFLGPIAGPIAAAAVTATLMGLLSWAMSAAFGSKSKSSSSTTNTKLTTGMLTYDSGNVQDLKPFVADNGEVYWAKENDAPQQSGVQMLNTPTATTINGQPSLVAECGPEIVIGRETTQAMMMNNPQLLKALVNYDKNYSGRTQARRAYDEGNVSAVLSAADGNISGATATDNATTAAAGNAALLQAVNTLIQRLSEPITAKVDMYGRGNLYDSMTKATQFMKNKT